MEKLIITLACTGNVPTKELNKTTPITPEEIVADLKECCELGVSIAHLHARDEDQQPTHSRDQYKAILDEIKNQKLNVITQLSTGARGGENTAESRGQMLDLDCEMGSLATGSSNFPTSVNANSPQLVEALVKKMYTNQIKPEIEAFDLAMISNAKRMLKKGKLKGPLHFNLVMGVPGSIEGSCRNLMFMVESLPENSTWSVCGIGPTQIPMITMGILLGGHIRTGLEDTLHYTKGVAATNKMLVERVVRLAKELGREIATPDEARKILGL
ncbi:MAG: 3-keto-5-aminohexanoate cleavage protein [Spirochaetes bacterium]|nr:3-keto-5-aminohexanoate cleavage protein [Spirochaetota bacterium]